MADIGKGWYHNGSETRRFSVGSPIQEIAFLDSRGTHFRFTALSGFAWIDERIRWLAPPGPTIHNTARYQYLLDLPSPWIVSRVNLDVNRLRVDIWIDHPEDAA